jgi:hypothetical protein
VLASLILSIGPSSNGAAKLGPAPIAAGQAAHNFAGVLENHGTSNNSSPEILPKARPALSAAATANASPSQPVTRTKKPQELAQDSATPSPVTPPILPNVPISPEAVSADYGLPNQNTESGPDPKIEVPTRPINTGQFSTYPESSSVLFQKPSNSANTGTPFNSATQVNARTASPSEIPVSSDSRLPAFNFDPPDVSISNRSAETGYSYTIAQTRPAPPNAGALLHGTDSSDFAGKAAASVTDISIEPNGPIFAGNGDAGPRASSQKLSADVSLALSQTQLPDASAPAASPVLPVVIAGAQPYVVPSPPIAFAAIAQNIKSDVSAPAAPQVLPGVTDGPDPNLPSPPIAFAASTPNINPEISGATTSPSLTGPAKDSAQTLADVPESAATTRPHNGQPVARPIVAAPTPIVAARPSAAAISRGFAHEPANKATAGSQAPRTNFEFDLHSAPEILSLPLSQEMSHVPAITSRPSPSISTNSSVPNPGASNPGQSPVAVTFRSDQEHAALPASDANSGAPPAEAAGPAPPSPAVAPKMQIAGNELNSAIAPNLPTDVAKTPQMGTRPDETTTRGVAPAPEPGGELPRVDAVAAPVVAARVMEGIGQAEMHIGLRTQAFGAVDVHTGLHDAQVALAVNSERGDLHSFLSPEMPALQNTLRQQDLYFESVRFTQQAAASSTFSGDGSSQSNSFGQQRPPSNGSQPVPPQVSLDDITNEISLPAEVSLAVPARLSVHA